MDAFILDKSLLEYLVNQSIASGTYDFLTDVIMKNIDRLKIMAVEHTGYVKRLSSVNSYYRMESGFFWIVRCKTTCSTQGNPGLYQNKR